MNKISTKYYIYSGILLTTLYFLLSSILMGPITELGVSSVILKRFTKTIGLGLFFIILYTKVDLKRSKNILTPLSLLSIGALLPIIIYDDYTSFSFLSPVSSFGVAIALLTFDLSKYLKAVIYILGFSYISFLLIGFHPDLTPLLFSQNGILTTSFTLLLAIIANNLRLKPLADQIFFPTLLITTIALLSSGRTNFFIAIFLLGIIIFQAFRNKNFKRVVLSITITLISLNYPFSWKYGYISQLHLKTYPHRIYKISHKFLGVRYIELTAQNKGFLAGRDSTDSGVYLSSLPYFNQYNLSSPRFKLWEIYFKSLSLNRILFGGIDIESDWVRKRFKGIYKKYNYNYHNSFLRAHKFGGILAILGALLMIFWFFKYTRSWFIKSFVITYILRMGTDSFVYYSLYSAPLFALGIFNWLKLKDQFSTQDKVLNDTST
jgi:hypothetical protein